MKLCLQSSTRASLSKMNVNKSNYGYRSRILIEKENDRIPKPFLELAVDNLKKELFQKKYGFVSDPYSDTLDKKHANDIRRRRQRLKDLKLNDTNIWRRECSRNNTQTPRFMMSVYYFMCWSLDIIYKNKPLDRFWFLETVARMPYFSYIQVLHMYETFGWWETGSKLKTKHHLEEANETCHLRIMESLGGDSLWWNRFLARHGAMVYYIVLLGFFMISPRLAYISGELLELHAVDTYREFLESNEYVLKDLPPTIESYEYMPYATSLYDIFEQISNDEYKHALSMKHMSNLPTN